MVSRLVDQRLSPAEAARLNTLLLESPEARARYQEFLDNHEALCAIYPGGIYSSSLDSKLAEVELPAAPKQTAQLPRSAWLQWAGVAAAIVIAVGAFIERSDVAPRAESSGARLVAAVDVVWQGNSRTEAPNASLLPGAALSLGDLALAEGTIELEFGDGARVSIQGPAKFELRNRGHIHLESGNLVARIPEEALGFVVTTPEAEVVDLGTEFGLSVSEGGRTDVHVIDGLVEVLPVRGDGEERFQIAEGDACRLDHQGVNGIEPATREVLLEPHRLDRYGLELLRGAVRVKEDLDLEAQTSGQHWIDVVPERRGVLVETPIEATWSAGSDAFFETWRFGDWNEIRVRCEGRMPELTTWINGEKMAWADTAGMRAEGYDAEAVAKLLGRSGSIALEVHNSGEGDRLGEERWLPGAVCRWRRIRVKDLA